MARFVMLGLLVVVALALPGRRPFTSTEIAEARGRWRAGDGASARTVAQAVLPHLGREVGAAPADPDRRMALAEALALSGEPARALAEARKALAAHPDPFAPASDGRGSVVETAAIVAMEAGQPEDALDLVELLLVRGTRARAVALASDERFAPLHGDARWQRLVEQYAGPAADPHATAILGRQRSR